MFFFCLLQKGLELSYYAFTDAVPSSPTTYLKYKKKIFIVLIIFYQENMHDFTLRNNFELPGTERACIFMKMNSNVYLIRDELQNERAKKKAMGKKR